MFLTKTIILIKNLMFFKINKRYVNKKNIQNNFIFKFNNNIKQFYILFLTFKKKIYPLQCCADTSIY